MSHAKSIMGFAPVEMPGLSQARVVSYETSVDFFGKRLCIPRETASDFVLVEYGVDRTKRKYGVDMKVANIPCGVFASPSENRDPPDSLLFPPLLPNEAIVLVVRNLSTFHREFRACVVGDLVVER